MRPSSTKVDFNGSYTKENDGPKDSLEENPGYTFGGWTESKSGDDVVFTANWIPRTDLAYTVNYYKDSVDAANLLGTDEGTGTFEAAIPWTDGSYLPAGYVTPGATSGQTTITADADANVLNVVYSKNTQLAYTVNYYFDDNLVPELTISATAEFESVAFVNPDSSMVYDDTNYVLVSENHSVTIGVDETANVIRVYYEKDTITDPNNDNNGDENPGDGISDKYQAVVNYESANDAQGTVNLAQKVVTFANNATSGTVNIFDGVATIPTAGFVFDGWTEGGNAVASNLTRELQGNTEYTFTANWALDVIGTDPTDPGNNVPDGIADKYQLVVTYAAIAGTIDGPARYVLNKYDAAGNLAEDGVAVLTAAQIPGATADDGYGNGVWNNEPLANMELIDDTAFVIAFTALPGSCRCCSSAGTRCRRRSGRCRGCRRPPSSKMACPGDHQ